MNRDDNLQTICERSEPWDMIVVGGGATGMGIAWDAASRGYEVLLLESADFAKGTSSRSTKLIHGGVRYLEQGNVQLVQEALHEQNWLLEKASSLVKPLKFVIPAYDYFSIAYYGVGLKVYDLLAARKGIFGSHFHGSDWVKCALGNVKEEELKGGVSYWDAEFDDARLVIELAKAASEFGATVMNHFPVKSLTKNEQGQVSGVIATDQLSGEQHELKAKAVVNATGVFSDLLRQDDQPKKPKIIKASRGVHLVVDRKFLPFEKALLVPKTSDGRVLFAVPWMGKVLLGTTDTAVKTLDSEPQASEEEIDFILEEAAKYLAEKPERKDVLSVFAGLRPLVQPESNSAKQTSQISRDHYIEKSYSGLFTITGGKWTTFRKMAEDLVDHVQKRLNWEERACITKDLEIRSTEHPDAETLLAKGELPMSEAILKQALEEEMAVTLEDVFARRTRCLFLDAQQSVARARSLGGLPDDPNTDGLSEFMKVAQNYQISLEKPKTKGSDS